MRTIIMDLPADQKDSILERNRELAYDSFELPNGELAFYPRTLVDEPLGEAYRNRLPSQF